MQREEEWMRPAILMAGLAVIWAIAFALMTGFDGRPNGVTSLIVSLAIIALAASWRFLRYLFGLWKTGVTDPIAHIRAGFRPALLDFVPILIGVAVVGVGLPQLGLERNLIRDHYDGKRGAGFDFAYVFPGFNRVLQAAGRVIRSEQDRGVVLLIDSRFSQERYRELFPPWWRTKSVRSENEIANELSRFWRG